VVKEIIWTPESEKSFEAVLTYLQLKWTQREVSNFIAKTNEVITHISHFPLSFRHAGKGDVREAVITEQTILLYRISGQTLYLLYFWSTKRNPAKKPI